MNGKVTDAAARLERAYTAGMDEEFRDDLRVVLDALPKPAKPEAVRLRDELRERADAPDVCTSEGGRRFIAEFFARELRRNDFDRYITTTLAADFACALAQYLAATGKQQVGYQSKYLDLLAEVLDAKETMRAAGIEQADFPKMFAEFARKKQVGEVRGIALPKTREELIPLALEIIRQLDLIDGHYDAAIAKCKADLAARQPVGQKPFAWFTWTRNRMSRLISEDRDYLAKRASGENADMDRGGVSECYRILGPFPLYTAPLAQADYPLMARSVQMLREACEYVRQRQDGDLHALVARCNLWMRESRALIDSMKKAPAQAVDLETLRRLLESAVTFYDSGFEGLCRNKIGEARALIGGQAVGS